MDGDGGSSLMNAYERDILGWIDPIDIEAEILNISLTDAFANGNIFKIKIPGSNPVQYYYLEKRQGSNYYENSWKSYNEGPLMSPGTGLLISKTLNPQLFGKPLDIECADGRWDWKRSGYTLVYPFEKIKSNRTINGYDELNLFKVQTTNGEQSHPNSLGESGDFFKIGYNQLFSPSSNPASNTVTFELVDNINETMHVNVYYSNYLQTAPSKPQNLKAVWDSGHPKITWEANLETDMSSYKIYYMVEGETGWGQIATIPHVPNVPSYSWTDYSVIVGTKWDSKNYIHYKVAAVDNTNKESICSDESKIYGHPTLMWKTAGEENQSKIDQNSLQQNYPNPFNPVTVIKYALPFTSNVNITVYNTLGQIVKEYFEGTKEAGYYTVNFDGENLSSGVYLYSINAVSANGKQNFNATKKMILMK